MKVSIVIPVYNVEPYLDECLATVQKLRTDFEAILVDDGSTDTSGAMCDAWAENDTRFRVIHRPNSGLSVARNTGVQSSTGDYVLFLDSDDFLDPAETDCMLQMLKEEPDVLIGLYRKFYTAENRYEEENSPALLSMQGLMPVEDFLAAIPPDGRSCYMVAVRFIVRRDLLLNYDLLFLPGIYHEDEEWTGRLLCAADSVLVSCHFFYQYRQGRAGSIMTAVKQKHILDSLRILECHDAVRRQQTPGSVKEQYLLRRMAQQYLNIMLNFYVLDTGARREMLAKLAKYRTLCVPYMAGIIGSTVKVFSGVVGIRITCFALKVMRMLLYH